MNTERFRGKVAIGAGGAGVESFVELWNPATSGKTIKITRIRFNAACTALKLKHHTVQLGASGTGGTKANKLLGGNASVISFYGHGLASVGGTLVHTFTLTSGALRSFDFDDGPLIIKPGLGMILELTTANAAITRASFDWHEIESSY